MIVCLNPQDSGFHIFEMTKWTDGMRIINTDKKAFDHPSETGPLLIGANPIPSENENCNKNKNASRMVKDQSRRVDQGIIIWVRKCARPGG